MSQVSYGRNLRIEQKNIGKPRLKETFMNGDEMMFEGL